MKRQIFASGETSDVVEKSGVEKISIYSMFPIDRADCACVQTIRSWQRRLGTSTEEDRRRLIKETPFIECPRDKSEMKHYAVKCKKCDEVQGYLWATSETIEDWCDFHYVQWTAGDFWHGCFTPHVSPVSEELCFECCCGQDTRDFRANMQLPMEQAEDIERRNSVGRKFGQEDSKFYVELAK